VPKKISTIRNPFLIIGHRGFAAKYPENTMAGFAAAITAGVEMIELDVQLSSDGHPVVIHDDELDRTTNGKGLVIDHSLSDLKKLDAGSWFDPTYENERIPTLEEVLDLVGNQTLINIEIKVKPEQNVRLLRDIEKITLALIRRKHFEQQVILSSFNKSVLESIHQLGRPTAIGVLTELGEELDIISVCRRLGAFSWHPQYLELDQNNVTRMHEHGIKVIPYTVNSPEDIQALSAMGVDGVFTDDPIAAAAYHHKILSSRHLQ
jgi:glycerophosphoryl diester phosphodiesterase